MFILFGKCVSQIQIVFIYRAWLLGASVPILDPLGNEVPQSILCTHPTSKLWLRYCHPLPALANSWTRGAARRHTTTPINHNVAPKLLLIFSPSDDIGG